MALHRLSSFTYEVPDVATVAEYYREFGLTDNGDGSFSTLDGGRQLFLRQGPVRRISGITLGADDPDDLGRIGSMLGALDVTSTTAGDQLSTVEPITGMQITVAVEPRIVQEPYTPPPTNYPGRTERVNVRAEGVMREDRVKPRKLGHVLIASADGEATIRFFTEGLGFKVSDYAGFTGNAFMRCSTDHHNVAVFSAKMSFPHHSSWQVNDVDDIGRGAEDLLEADDGRQIWGFGRHFAGSNFFWYLKDPAGTYSEYYVDMDQITDDELWAPQVAEGARGLYRWGPKPPESFVTPADIAELIAAQAN